MHCKQDSNGGSSNGATTTTTSTTTIGAPISLVANAFIAQQPATQLHSSIQPQASFARSGNEFVVQPPSTSTANNIIALGSITTPGVVSTVIIDGDDGDSESVSILLILTCFESSTLHTQSDGGVEQGSNKRKKSSTSVASTSSTAGPNTKQRRVFTPLEDAKIAEVGVWRVRARARAILKLILVLNNKRMLRNLVAIGQKIITWANLNRNVRATNSDDTVLGVLWRGLANEHYGETVINTDVLAGISRNWPT